ncbi:hypothetical protein [Crocosphaera sp.]|uniref:hypothetical protein n=1 Tax=Crocosphaera sp. TaxID=2729996 RepID=UPI00261EA6DC|nr:hypothetical protein [Crocosphaera sp.]MDJ0583278.1 hypothetical protein [Crocosphaera sp.]
MNYLNLAQPWLEWESELIAEDQHNCYINGQNDALSLTKPEEPNNQCYMMGWEETMKKIATGEIKPELLDSNYPESTADEEF